MEARAGAVVAAILVSLSFTACAPTESQVRTPTPVGSRDDPGAEERDARLAACGRAITIISAINDADLALTRDATIAVDAWLVAIEQAKSDAEQFERQTSGQTFAAATTDFARFIESIDETPPTDLPERNLTGGSHAMASVCESVNVAFGLIATEGG